MPKDRDDVEPNSEQPGFLWKELRHLIEILQDLHLQVSSKLLEKRVRPPTALGTDESGLDISQALKDYVDTNLGDQAQGREATKPLHEGPSSAPDEPASAESAPAGDHAAGSPVHPNELSGYLKDKTTGQEFARYMGEKMRTTTLDHLNRTVQLARQGNRQGAYIHAELAENAMRLARKHMSTEEFERFKDEIRTRVDAAKSSAHPGTL